MSMQECPCPPRGVPIKAKIKWKISNSLGEVWKRKSERDGKKEKRIGGRQKTEGRT